MKKPILLFLMIVVLVTPCSLRGQSLTGGGVKPTKVLESGDSVLEAMVSGKPIRVVITTYRVDLGATRPTPPPTGEGNTNCTYSRFPCSQVSNLRIWVAGNRLFVPRSVFADIADVGNMSMASEGGVNILTLVGGDGSEAYSVKVFFGVDRVKKREFYGLESNKVLQVTTYQPLPVFD